MELLGIGLGLLTALLWGTSDVIATMSARRWKTFKITVVSQSAGFLGLVVCGIVAFVFLDLSLTQTTVVLSLLIGVVTGIVAAFGYFYCYRALEAGPIALVSPLTSTSSVFTLLLSLFVLRQGLTVVQIGAVVLCILGVLLASTNPRAIRAVLKTSGYTFFNQGVRWALLATLAFGVMDFGIGASAAISGWFLPVLWTRIFSICALTLISFWKRRQRLKRAQLAGAGAALPQAGLTAVSSALSAEHLQVAGQQRTEDGLQMAGSTFDWSGASSLASLSNPEALDPDATLISRPSLGDRSLAALDPDSTLLRLRVYSGELPVPVRRSSTFNLLEASLQDSFNLQPVRSLSPYLTQTGDTNRLHQRDLSHLGSNGSSQDNTASAQSSEQEVSASGPLQRSPSLALPSLAELSQLRMPRASKLGMGVLLAIIAGIGESAAVLSFSIDTRLATTGVAAAIASGYSLIVILFGLTFYHERLAWNQVGGIILFLAALIFLAFV
ncbi:MAG TPA: DMT family transporter [Ktedonobacterales bacterium]|jgi:drug/metabolite transporter (DMT)-like permease